MGKTVTIEVPDELYAILERQAREAGRPLQDLAAEWLALHAPKTQPSRTKDRLERRNALWSMFGSVETGNLHGSDNERIDLDLAREYGNELDEEP